MGNAQKGVVAEGHRYSDVARRVQFCHQTELRRVDARSEAEFMREREHLQ